MSWLALSRRGANLPNPPRVTYPPPFLLQTPALPSDASGRAATVAALRAHSAARSCDVLRAPALEFDFPAYTSRAALTFTISL